MNAIRIRYMALQIIICDINKKYRAMIETYLEGIEIFGGNYVRFSH